MLRRPVRKPRNTVSRDCFNYRQPALLGDPTYRVIPGIGYVDRPVRGDKNVVGSPESGVEQPGISVTGNARSRAVYAFLDGLVSDLPECSCERINRNTGPGPSNPPQDAVSVLRDVHVPAGVNSHSI